MSQKRFTETELAILKELLQNKFLRYTQILPIFHEKIGRVEFHSISSFKTWLSKNKIGRGFQPCYKQFHNQEEMDFVIELMNNKELTWKEIALAFWTKYRSGKMPKTFKRNLQETMTKTHKIRRPEDLLNDGKFKSSDNHRQLPIGSEVVKMGRNKSDRQSYVWVKVNDVKLPNANESAESKKLANRMYKENWKPKHVLIWENYHNEKVKENEIVISFNPDDPLGNILSDEYVLVDIDNQWQDGMVIASYCSDSKANIFFSIDPSVSTMLMDDENASSHHFRLIDHDAYILTEGDMIRLVWMDAGTDRTFTLCSDGVEKETLIAIAETIVLMFD